MEPVTGHHAERSASGTLGISRVFALLRILGTHNREGMRLTEIAQRLSLTAPTAHRILKCLAEERVLRRDGATKLYHLGPAIFELGITARPRLDLRALCEPAMVRIAEQTEDTVFLTKRSGLDSVCLSRKEGKFPVKTLTLDVGIRRPLGVGSGSLAILSALPETEIKAVLRTNADRLVDYDGLSASSLLHQIRRTQKQSYATRDLRGLGGVRTIGVAIRNEKGTPFASLSISAIRSRMKDERVTHLAEILKAEALKIEKQIAAQAHDLD